MSVVVALKCPHSFIVTWIENCETDDSFISGFFWNLCTDHWLTCPGEWWSQHLWSCAFGYLLISFFWGAGVLLGMVNLDFCRTQDWLPQWPVKIVPGHSLFKHQKRNIFVDETMTCHPTFSGFKFLVVFANPKVEILIRSKSVKYFVERSMTTLVHWQGLFFGGYSG